MSSLDPRRRRRALLLVTAVVVVVVAAVLVLRAPSQDVDASDLALAEDVVGVAEVQPADPPADGDQVARVVLEDDLDADEVLAAVANVLEALPGEESVTVALGGADIVARPGEDPAAVVPVQVALAAASVDDVLVADLGEGRAGVLLGGGRAAGAALDAAVAVADVLAGDPDVGAAVVRLDVEDTELSLDTDCDGRASTTWRAVGRDLRALDGLLRGTDATPGPASLGCPGGRTYVLESPSGAADDVAALWSRAGARLPAEQLTVVTPRLRVVGPTADSPRPGLRLAAGLRGVGATPLDVAADGRGVDLSVPDLATYDAARARLGRTGAAVSTSITMTEPYGQVTGTTAQVDRAERVLRPFWEAGAAAGARFPTATAVAQEWTLSAEGSRPLADPAVRRDVVAALRSASTALRGTAQLDLVGADGTVVLSFTWQPGGTARLDDPPTDPTLRAFVRAWDATAAAR